MRSEHHRLAAGDAIVLEADAAHVDENLGAVPTIMDLVTTYD